MVYKINITEHADEQLDNITYYLLYRLKNDQAAKHLLESLSKIYDRLVDNPYQFHHCNDEYLRGKGYMEAVVSGMDKCSRHFSSAGKLYKETLNFHLY